MDGANSKMSVQEAPYLREVEKENSVGEAAYERVARYSKEDERLWMASAPPHEVAKWLQHKANVLRAAAERKALQQAQQMNRTPPPVASTLTPAKALTVSSSAAGAQSAPVDMCKVLDSLKTLMNSITTPSKVSSEEVVNMTKTPSHLQTPLKNMSNAELEKFSQAVLSLQKVVARQQAKAQQCPKAEGVADQGIQSSAQKVQAVVAEISALTELEQVEKAEARPGVPLLPPGLDVELDVDHIVRVASASSACSGAGGDEWWNYHSDSFQVAEPDVDILAKRGARLTLGIEVDREKSSQHESENKPGSAKSSGCKSK